MMNNPLIWYNRIRMALKSYQSRCIRPIWKLALGMYKISLWSDRWMQTAWTLVPSVHTPPKKVFGQWWLLVSQPSFSWFFSEALSFSPRVLTNEVNIGFNGMSCIMNFDNWQWVWKYLIIYIRLFKNSLCCITVLRNLCFWISLPIRSKYSSDNNPCACYKVWYAER